MLILIFSNVSVLQSSYSSIKVLTAGEWREKIGKLLRQKKKWRKRKWEDCYNRNQVLSSSHTLPSPSRGRAEGILVQIP